MQPGLVERAQRGDQDAFARLATDSVDRCYAIAYRILRDHASFFPGLKIYPDESPFVGMHCRMNDQTLFIRIETSNERPDVDLAGKESALERHHDQIAPRLVRRSAHPHD